MSRFEELLAWWIGRRPCDLCRKPLGNGPRYWRRWKQYHIGCYEGGKCDADG